ncbi:PREDICTED: integrin beta-PS-like [Nicrophorus vespilloides]|uniref:Integrin beta n=1 Tax=Nicrophorus vespilloides TaxID=110193 RepID=A0ABM1NBY8_NICVS|nr:PREDICTED: integrin beta-PS-like [Nicrophorus vespilloides]
MLLHALLVILAIVTLPKVFAQSCITKSNCSECIQEYGCAWCSEPGPNKQHCYRSGDTQNECFLGKAEDPKSKFTILSNKNLQSQANLDPIQLKPQHVKLVLRKGEEYKMNFQYAQASNFPIDLYYIIDLSYSMKKYKINLALLGDRLIETMRNITTNFKIGFGSFVDKVDMPFVNTEPNKRKKPCSNCVPAYSFINYQSLNNGETFSKEVAAAKESGNQDTPEGGFDALMQAMVCKDVIGWRETARRIIVFSTDATSHIAGDGKLAGVVEPNPGLCFMTDNQYTHDLVYDYPSISHINHLAKQLGFNIFFAIANDNIYSVYEAMQNEIENTATARLNAQSDLLYLITKFYRDISDVIKITDDSSSAVQITYEADCKSKIENGCKAVHAGEVINFVAKIKVLDCSKSKHQIRIKPGTFSETLLLDLDVHCNCDCEQQQKNNSDRCKKKGALVCGLCSCNSGHYGKQCECNSESFTTNDIASCMQSNATKEICSGLGVCKCSVCECNKRQNPDEHIYGKYCECDDYSCRKSSDGKICNGNGKCDCKKCKCDAGFTGEECQCPTNLAPCTHFNNVCNSKGTCECGKCTCESGYYGTYCEECATCSGRKCEELQDCVQCKTYNSGKLKDSCDISCSQYQFNKVKQIKESEETEDSDFRKVCKLPIEQNCVMVFSYFYNDDKDISVDAESKMRCSKPIDILALVFGVILSTIIVGILTLVIWKLCTTIHDRREYAKFENERKQANWNRNDNPLFKTPVTRFENPTFNEMQKKDEQQMQEIQETE